jgi:hypothetical protein
LQFNKFCQPPQAKLCESSSNAQFAAQLFRVLPLN